MGTDKKFQKEFFPVIGFEKNAMAGCEYVSRNKLEERYLKYRHFYVGLDLSGFGDYGRAVYAILRSLSGLKEDHGISDTLGAQLTFAEYNESLHDHPDFRKETGEVIDFHIKVLALSLDGLILDENRNAISKQFLGNVIFDVSRHTRSYDFSNRLCFSITVRLFIEMLKERFSHFGSPVADLSLCDFANEDTLNPKPQEVIDIPW